MFGLPGIILRKRGHIDVLFIFLIIINDLPVMYSGHSIFKAFIMSREVIKVGYQTF